MAEPYVPQPSFYQRVRYVLEASVIFPVFYLFKIIPYEISSFLIGKLTAFFGPFHSANKIAIQNITEAFPEKSEEEIKKIARGAWENLGRTAGEFVVATGFSKEKIAKIIQITNREYAEEALKASPAHNTIVISAHLGNWEIGSRIVCDIIPNLALIYRHANNPYVESLIQERRKLYTPLIIKKGSRSGFREIYSHLKKGGNLGMLVDQKTREGIDLEFFGKPVRVVSTPAEIALKFGLKIIMVRCIRKNNTEFEISFDKPISTEGKTVEQIMTEVYQAYERWISEHPDQWFWMHNRWYIGRKPYLV